MKRLLTLLTFVLLTSTYAQTQFNKPMERSRFAGVLRDLSADTYNLPRNARQLVRNECLISSQLFQVALLFRNDAERMDFTLFAYTYVMDPQNYDLMADAFGSQQDRNEIYDFLDRNRHDNQPYNPNPPVNPIVPITPPVNPIVVPPPPPPPAPIIYVPGYTGRLGCEYPMADNDFSNALNSISSKSFENTKVQIAKQIISSNCMTTAQVKQVLRLFSFDNTRLDFAKYAYDYVYDIDNYYQVTDEFDFESNGRDLINYMNGHTPAHIYVPPVYTYPEYVPVQGGGGGLQPLPVMPAPNQMGCQYASTSYDFSDASNAIKSGSFDNTKVDLAKNIIRNKCFTAAQIRDLCKLISFDNSRLDLAKYAYDYCYDKQNYYQVTDAFSFESNKRDLLNYIKGR